WELARVAHEKGAGSNVDDARARALLEEGIGGASHEPVAEEIDVHIALDLGPRPFTPRLARRKDAGVVDENVEAIDAAFHLAKGPGHVFLIRDVALEGKGAAAGCFDLSDHLVRWVSIEDGELRSVAGEAQTGRTAQAFGATGDQSDGPVESAHC